LPYIPHTEADLSRILDALGASSVEDALGGLPAGLRLDGRLLLPPGLSEQELLGSLKRMSRRNSTVEEYSSFLGAGAYSHFIPSTVEAVISRSEFYTSYTPYQPEVSQGTLQAVFEYQSLVCALTSMDVTNASMYDGASATAEAVLMARRITGRGSVVLSAALHPEYRETVKTYLAGSAGSIREALYCTEEGMTVPEALSTACTDDTACVVIQNPNFFGCIEDVDAASRVVHGKGGLLIAVVTEPVSLGVMKPPGACGCDIAAGEMQSFGCGLNYGGPYLGFLAARGEFVRQMPGRLVGETLDADGARAYCLTFSTREQHIRRERATSNICTNHALSALAASVHMASLGKGGMEALSRLNLSKAEYLKKRLAAIDGVKMAFSAPTFNEFVVELPSDADAVLRTLLKRRIIGGLRLKRFYAELPRHILCAATETNSREEMDAFADGLGAGLRGR
jgi:glycine dehydrogenase subunit 1